MRGKSKKKKKGRPIDILITRCLSRTGIGILLPDTVRAGVIENDTGVSRISLFGRGGNIEKILFQPQLERVKKRNTVVLTRRGSSNALAGFLIILALRVLYCTTLSKSSVPRSYRSKCPAHRPHQLASKVIDCRSVARFNPHQ